MVVAYSGAAADAFWPSPRPAMLVQARTITPEQALQLEPHLNPQIAAAVHYPDDAQVQPTVAVEALLASARKAGACVRTRERVVGALRDATGDRIVGVRTDRADHAADAVVNAAGPWAGEVAALLGAPVPVLPRFGMVLVTPRMPHRVFHKVYDADYVGATQSGDADLQTSAVVESTACGNGSHRLVTAAGGIRRPARRAGDRPDRGQGHCASSNTGTQAGAPTVDSGPTCRIIFPSSDPTTGWPVSTRHRPRGRRDRPVGGLGRHSAGPADPVRRTVGPDAVRAESLHAGAPPPGRSMSSRAVPPAQDPIRPQPASAVDIEFEGRTYRVCARPVDRRNSAGERRPRLANDLQQPGPAGLFCGISVSADCGHRRRLRRPRLPKARPWR